MFNPLSPNIHIQILHTDLYIFPLRISWENLIKDQGIFSLVIILLTLIVTLITFSLANLWISSGENWCWSLLGLKGLNNSYIAIECDHNCLDGMYYLGVIQLNLVFSMFSFCATWMNKFNVSDTQNFWRAKRVCYQFCSEIYSLQEQMSVTDFSRMARLGRFTADCLWLKTFPGREKWWGCIKSIGC